MDEWAMDQEDMDAAEQLQETENADILDDWGDNRDMTYYDVEYEKNSYHEGCSDVEGHVYDIRRKRHKYNELYIYAKCNEKENDYKPLTWVVGVEGKSKRKCHDDWIEECHIDGKKVSCKLWVGPKSYKCKDKYVNAKLHVLCC